MFDKKEVIDMIMMFNIATAVKHNIILRKLAFSETELMVYFVVKTLIGPQRLARIDVTSVA